ncbi:hypothetical protein DFH07DRAFT_776817 [Mycena maculata]|uniref:F-box domain-containing protein n=1 Tax=Mycena maculata TaxID=230809 RepID=A0AAD7N5F7_9AGAR|nr:hypothetical protein DFH07DRAFT_776817 [Mycena maculata]
MSSAAVNKLRIRIEEISSKIECQKQVLWELETQRSAAQGEINAILDPMARWPLEISFNIFTLCLPTTPTFDPLEAPTLLLSICHHIAYSTPLLWAAISDTDVPLHEFPKFFESWLSRVRPSPLSLFLCESLQTWQAAGVPAAVQALVKEYAHQVRNLELNLPFWGDDLQRITTPFRSLQSLSLTVNARTSGPSTPNISEYLGMLHAAPILVECIFLNVLYMSDYGVGDITTFTHHSLQHLALGKPQGEGTHGRFSSAALLKYLTLPALWALTISKFDITSADFLSFLTRSAPPLRSLNLRLGDQPAIIEASGTAYLRLVPRLTDLDIGVKAESTLPLLEVFGSVGDLFPTLRNLTIRGSLITRSGYEGVINILSSRRASLQSFRFIPRVPDDIAVVIQQLTKDGMRIEMIHLWND